MSFELNAIFSLSISLAVVIGWVRFRRIDPAYLPFLVLLTIGCLNEAISIVLMEHGFTNIINFNTFKLIESLLLTWQFLKWGLFEKRKVLYTGLQVIFILSWLAEIGVHSIRSFNSYFIILHSFLLVMMSISMINLIVLKETTPLWKQPVFLICMGLIAYFTYAIFVEAFWIVGLNHRRLFRLKIFEIMAYINLLTNLIFAFAFLWIPMRPRYILRL
jgi:hypothetical protein